MHLGKEEFSVVNRPRSSQWTAIPMEEALKIVYDAVVPNLTKTVPVNLNRTGFVLAEQIIATHPYPQVRTSVKDGYAVIATDGPGPKEVITVTTAGSITDIVVRPGTCCRVSTGSMIPEGADAVVQVEDTALLKHNNVEELVVDIKTAVKSGTDIREVGSDISIGQILLEKNCVLGSAEIGILAASGRRHIEVYRKPKACVITTGNELVDFTADDVPLGKIRDTNRPQLMALLNSNGFKAIDGGIVSDTRKHICEALDVAFKFSDVLVITGGVSMGEKDLMKTVLQQDFGFTINFGRIFMKPGLPTTFATGKWRTDAQRFVFALPGNPVSSWVSAQLFVVPALRKMAGYKYFEHTVIKVKLTESISLDRRPEYRRAWLDFRMFQEATPVAVCTSKNQLSSQLLNTRGANLLLRLPGRTEEKPFVKEGEIVDALIIGPI
uniref:MoaB/Mog domain-containing protein n=1 Tax=Acrobeloides nanus TaxID=290746 RepID=A0A914DZ70_9BILA